ncbi:MAG: alpha/beta hydrolase, partial [Actinobacteria bacterium]|nr:alpha/beta hydrolase [Actinomycetota bacterium]
MRTSAYCIGESTMRKPAFTSALVVAVTASSIISAPAYADEKPTAVSVSPGVVAEQNSAPQELPTKQLPAKPIPQVRGDIAKRVKRTKTVVATPKRSQASLVVLKVRSRSTPKVRVKSVGRKAGTKKTTVIAGVKRLSQNRSSISTYRISIPILKPRINGSRNTKGRVQIKVVGRGLSTLNTRTFTNTRTKRVSNGICRAVSGKYLDIRTAKSALGFGKRAVFGPELSGFRDSGYVGVFAVSQACRQRTTQSYLNALTGRNSAATPRSVVTNRAGINSSTGSGDAVVLVSGFMSQTPFTTPGNTCSATGMSSGGTWSVMQSALATAGYPVFTVPETTYDYSTSGEPTPVAINPATMGLGSCAATQLPASLTLNTAGDFDLNSSILANVLEYINTNYGITNVWLVGHSDGGLWARGAMDYASFMSGVSINSVTTIDTPYTGSFLSNTAADQTTGCGLLNPSCDALEAILKYFSESLAQGAALNEMTSSYMVQWNSRMANVAGNTPFYAASAIGINDPDTFDSLSSGTGTNPFYNPNDVAVGIASQQAQGLVENGTIASLACFPTIPGLHTQIP